MAPAFRPPGPGRPRPSAQRKPACGPAGRQARLNAVTCVSIWTLMVAAMAFGGALLLWSTVSRAKQTSELMLIEYREMLARAREERAKQLARQAADARGAEEPTIPRD